MVVVKYRNASADPGDSDGESIRAIQKHSSLWVVSYIGAVTDPSVPLDARLRDDGKTKAMVVGLLHSIDKSLRRLDAFNPAVEQEKKIV
ncbi:hypothetical protein EPUS_08681 [Endocarpon pusillum Z07020]|uniref:Uncharacterized protein n=1 Tax=Endocarpon pusillum (strain Z07020 / HMAS-L-300199) TaxID=1263415 RepID=U1I4R8_ENDPU|nr:uncharacterized protein EPUS_08681 [Endocarpon pusillum Z07020]ERF77114.1 hypothetical protein EPUS_08681 [Endocarpon pusillum Z07020]